MVILRSMRMALAPKFRWRFFALLCLAVSLSSCWLPGRVDAQAKPLQAERGTISLDGIPFTEPLSLEGQWEFVNRNLSTLNLGNARHWDLLGRETK